MRQTDAILRPPAENAKEQSMYRFVQRNGSNRQDYICESGPEKGDIEGARKASIAAKSKYYSESQKGHNCPVTSKTNGD